MSEVDNFELEDGDELDLENKLLLDANNNWQICKHFCNTSYHSAVINLCEMIVNHPFYFIECIMLNPKTVGGEGVNLTPLPPCGFSKDVISEDLKNFSVNISYFHQFTSICCIFSHFLVTKKLMISAHNR